MHRFVTFFLFTILFTSGFSQGKMWVPDPAFRAYLKLYASPCFVGDSLDTAAAHTQYTFTSVSISQNSGITDLTGIEQFWELKSISISTGIISKIPPLSKLYKLGYVYITNNLLAVFPDFSSNTELYYINLSGNKFTSVPDLSANFKLKELHLNNNKLASLPKLDKLLNLQIFECGFCGMKTLPDLSNNKLLEYLYASNNQLTSLPSLTNNTKLTSLECGNNLLTALPDLTKCTELKRLEVWHNKLTTVPDLTKNTKLLVLYLSDNPLPKLPDLSTLADLQELWVSSLNLDSLPSLSQMTSLQVLVCTSNRLKKLPSFKGITYLRRLECEDNLLTELPDLTDNYYMLEIGCRKNLLTKLPPTSMGKYFYRLECDSNRLDFSDADQLLYFDKRIKSSVNASLALYKYAPQMPFGDTARMAICLGQPFVLTVDSQKHATSYRWFKNGKSIPGAADTLFLITGAQLSDSGVYECHVYGNALKQPNFNYGPGLDSFISAPFYVKVFQTGIKINTDAGKDISVCLGDSATLNGSGSTKFTWINGSKQVIGTKSKIRIKPFSSAWYYLTSTDDGGCNSATDSVFVSVVNYPTVKLGMDTTIKEGETIVLNAGNPGCTYLWSTGETTQKINVSKTGNYSVTVTNSAGCSSTGSKKVTVLGGSGIDGFGQPNGMTVFPTPFSNELIFDYLPVDRKISLAIFNSTGQEMMKWDLYGTKQFRINTTQLPAGIYTVRMIDGNKFFVRTCIKN